MSKEDADKQHNESESIQNQKNLLIRYAVEHGWDIYDVYCDEDYSGADRLRPAFNRMIDEARQKKFQIVLCKTQSRFTRDMELVEKYIHGLFPAWGIRFVAVADNADTDVKGNKKARQIAGLVNEWYLEDLSENIRMVFDMKRKEGKYIGGSPVYGYKKDPTNKNHLVIDPEAAEVVRQIFQWSLEGHGKQNIAYMLNERGVANPTRYKEEKGLARNHYCKRDFGLWNKITVWRILRNEMYAGVMVQGRTRKVSYKSKAQINMPEDKWVRVEGTHEAIIDRKTFDAVQKGMDLRTRTDGTGAIHPLAGLVKCMDCGSTMSKTKNHYNHEYLRCRLFTDSGKQRLCTNHAIRLDRLVEYVSEQVRTYVQSYFDLSKADLQPKQDIRTAEMESEKKAAKADLEKRSSALRALYLDKVSGVISDGQFADMNAAFLLEKNRLEKRISEIDERLTERAKPQRSEDLMRRAEELLKLENVPRELFIALIDEIRVGQRDPETGEQKIEIRWKF